MARPISDKAVFKVRLPKSLIADLDEQHWTERRETCDIVRDALIDYIAAHKVSAPTK